MNRSATLIRDPGDTSHPVHDVCVDDPRWQLTQRILASRHLVRSPLLSRLLLHVVKETLQGRSSQITEHRLGVDVFRRPFDYRTVDDNIVRNYARQLRKRLVEYFADEGLGEALHLQIAVGGYVPAFSEVDRSPSPVNAQVVSIDTPPSLPPDVEFERQHWFKVGSSRLRAFLLLFGYSLLLIGVTWQTGRMIHANRTSKDAAHLLWTTIFQGAANCYIVPADAGLNLMEDLSHQSVTLVGYLDGHYGDSYVSGIDAHSAEDLHTQQFTSFVDMQVVTRLATLPEFKSPQVSLRFPRDLRLDDLKNSNAVIIGSITSNPWAAISSSNADFKIVALSGMSGSTIIDKHPAAGEPSTYASHWNEPSHETFALVSFLPNLSNTGHVLLIQGLDAAGTQAAAETLFSGEAIAPIMRNASGPDGLLRPFEILVRTTSMQSNALNTRIVTVRIH